MTLARLKLDDRRAPPWAAAEPHVALLDPRGARVILGDQIAANGLPDPVAPRPHTFFGPRGVCLAARGGPLIVCDTGHHRLMLWCETPETDNAPADIVIGQPDFVSEGRNARGAIGPATLNMPTGVSIDGDVLAVADTGNRRVLVWNALPERPGQPADLVLGQTDMATRDDNASGLGGAVGMRWPHGVAVDGSRILVTDAGNSRIMVWNAMPNADGAPCAYVLGQGTFDGLDHNRAGAHPGARALNMPYGIAVRDGALICADTANSRLVGYPLGSLAMDAPATGLAAQPGFAAKGDNRWRFAERDSLCWPFGVAVCGSTFAIADTGNNRVLLWEAAS